MLKPYSDFLKARPSVVVAGRGSRIRYRILIAVICIITTWYLVNDVLPKSTIWEPIYWLHDHIYLVIKGYFFWLYHPISWIWWGILFTILGLAFFSWVFDRSLIREPHIWLLRRALGRPYLHRYLLSTTYFFERTPRLSADLLITTAADVQFKQLHNILQQTPKSVKVGYCRRVIALAQLRYQFHAIHGWTQADYWEALAEWGRIYLLLTVFGQSTDTLSLATLLDHLPHAEFANEGDSTNTVPSVEFSGFSLATLLENLRLLLAGEGERVIFSAEQRRLILSRICHIVEAQQRSINPARLRISTLPIGPDLFPFAADIGLTIALHLTHQTEDPRFAQGMIDALTSLRLVSGWSADGVSHMFGKLTERVPNAESYQLLGLLQFNTHTDWEKTLPLLKGENTEKHPLEWAMGQQTLQAKRWQQAMGPQEEA